MTWGIREQLAWRGALSVALLNACGWIFDLLIAREIHGMPLWPGVVAAAGGALAAVVLIARRRRASVRFSSALFLVQVAFIICALWVTNEKFATSGRAWAPFQADKLGAMTVGLLTPELWVGLVSIAAYFLAVLAQLALFAPEVRHSMAVGEPWATAVFALFAVVLLIQSHRRYELERRGAHEKEQAASVERLARAFLAIRDYANTPLQTIESTAALAVMTRPDTAESMAPITRAVDKLRKLNRALSKLESRIEWHTTDIAIDAEQLLTDVGESGIYNRPPTS